PYRLRRAGGAPVRRGGSVVPPRGALNSPPQAAVLVGGAPRILIVSNSLPQSLVTALKMRKYQIDFVSPRSLSEHPVDYLPYQLVILDDVPEGSLTPAAQHALNRYVADYGGGIVATGDTLREDKLAGGELEKALPVKFVPQPPPPSR